MKDKKKNTQLIKNIAQDLGFSFCGISKSGFLEKEAKFLEIWLSEGKHGKMQYMENYFDKRVDTRLLVEDSKSVISLMINYFPKYSQENNVPKISKYAYGDDYHEIIKEKLKVFFNILKENIGDISGRFFVDSAPVMDKVWAKKSGLGWQGKNTNIINPKSGSFFFLSEIIIDVDLEYDTEINNFCGTCNKCIEACPTSALSPYIIDASKCISYLTIELKDELIDKEFKNKMQNWIFGCDICQDVCPWNRFSIINEIREFTPKYELLNLSKEDWEELSEEQFKILAKNSPLKRSKWKGLKRNIKMIE